MSFGDAKNEEGNSGEPLARTQGRRVVDGGSQRPKTARQKVLGGNDDSRKVNY